MSEQEMTIGFIGNPNCGKTTLFNAYTGANLKVANWPGVTVEKVEGVMKDHDLTIHLVDLPGTYSLTSYTMEETVSRQFILSDEVDVIINVADASALERSLYLTLQLLELGKPVVLALNMMDIVEKTRTESRFVTGVSTRGAIALYKASQAMAASLGRDFVIPEDVKAAAPWVLSHRIISRGGESFEDARKYLGQIMEDIPVPMENLR